MNELYEGMLIQSRYFLKKLLGRGSFGEVWLAYDNLSKLHVALKIYISLDPAGIEEFRQEYSHTVSFSSPYLLHVQHFDVYEHRPFLVMKYCEKGSAERLVGKMTETALWQFVHDVAAGLNVLHSQKTPILHQDIKPDNILVDETGRFVITDFGVSLKLRTTLQQHSEKLVNAGTLSFMAPEKFESLPSFLTASDIWSLGISIYYLAMGLLPFDGQGGVMLRAGAELPSLPDSYSADLNNLMQKCLALKPSERPTAQQLQNWASKRKCPGKAKRAVHPKGRAVRRKSNKTVVLEGSKRGINKLWHELKNDKRFYVYLALPVVICGIVVIYSISGPSDEQIATQGLALKTQEVNTEASVTDSDTIVQPDTDFVTPPPPIEQGPIVRKFSIKEGYYSVSYTVTGSKGSIDVVMYEQGQRSTYTLRTNPNADISRVLDQFEGMAYYRAAGDISVYIVNENGFYSEENMASTIRLLSKSADAFSVSRGGDAMSYQGAKSRLDMLRKISRNPNEQSISEIDMIVYGIGENPVAAKDIRNE